MAGILKRLGNMVGGRQFSVSSSDELKRAIEKANNGATITLTADFSMRDDPPEISKALTIEGDGHKISGAGWYRIFHVVAGGDLTIRNLTMTRGKAEYGGAISVQPGRDDTASLTISECSFSRNSAEDDGGAIYSWGEKASLTISDCSFSRNSAEDDGGAICSAGEKASLTISDCSFSDNSAKCHGGAIDSYGDDSILTISDSSFSDNSAKGHGGAIYSWGDTASLTVSGCEFSSNWTEFKGGAISLSLDGGSLNISDSSFSGNSAEDDGGAIYCDHYSSLNISDSSFSGNSAESDGGAIGIMGGSATLTHLTLVGNSAEEAGGGIYVSYLQNSVEMYNCILADNSGGDCGGDREELESSQNCIIKDGSVQGEGLIADDPMLGDWVAPSDGKTGYFPLLAGSPALGAADERLATDKDQLGQLRPPGAPSIGAVEYNL